MSEEHVDEQPASELAPVQTFKLLELIEEIRMTYEIENEFNFSILIEQNPIDRKFSYVCKVLAIISKEVIPQSETDDARPGDPLKMHRIRTIHYDEIVKHGLNYVEVKKKRNQKIGIKTPSFIDGCSVVKQFEGFDYVEFNLRFPNKRDLASIEQIRQKYNIPRPYQFKSESLHLSL
jgi:hypothetical protein